VRTEEKLNTQPVESDQISSNTITFRKQAKAPPEACDSLGSRPFSKGIAGDSERSERKGTKSSLSSPMEVTPPEACDSLGDSEQSERKKSSEVTRPFSLSSKRFLDRNEHPLGPKGL